VTPLPFHIVVHSGVPQHIVIAKLLISHDDWQRSQSGNALSYTQRRLARCGAVLVPLCTNSVWEREQSDGVCGSLVAATA
jgi:hypothetical protein